MPFAMLIPSLRSEWRKQQRSLLVPLIVGTAFFTPAILTVFRLVKSRPGGAVPLTFWSALWRQSWESMAVMLLPTFTICLSGLLLQLEWRSNAWKQTCATPQSLATIWTAKLLMHLVMLAACLGLFTIGVMLSGVVPPLLRPALPMPTATIPWAAWAADLGRYYLELLPVVAGQFLLGLRLRNPIAPFGVGLGLWILSVGMLGWQYHWLLPYGLAAADFLQTRRAPPPISLPWIGLTMTLILLAASLRSFRRAPEHG